MNLFYSLILFLLLLNITSRSQNKICGSLFFRLSIGCLYTFITCFYSFFPHSNSIFLFFYLLSFIVIIGFDFFYHRSVLQHRAFLKNIENEYLELSQKMTYHDEDEKQLQHEIQETHAKLEQTSSIYNATLTMSHFLDFNEILHSFVKSLGGFDGFKKLHLVLNIPTILENNKELAAYSYSLDDKIIKESPVNKDEEVLFSRVKNEKKFSWVTDAPAFGLIPNSFDLSAKNPALIVPLFFQDDYSGALILFIEKQIYLEQLELLTLHFSMEIHKSKLYHKIKHLSTIDTLSGAYLKRHFYPLLEEEIVRNKEIQKEAGLIMIDIDRFKEINDRHGHLAGDHVIREIGSILKSRCREEDIICRYGGDEFVIVLPRTSQEQAIQVAQRIKNSVSDLVFNPGTKNEFKTTVSMGIAMFPNEGDSSQKLLQSADQSLYAAKRGGRDKIEISSDSQNNAPLNTQSDISL